MHRRMQMGEIGGGGGAIETWEGPATCDVDELGKAKQLCRARTGGRLHVAAFAVMKGRCPISVRESPGHPWIILSGWGCIPSRDYVFGALLRGCVDGCAVFPLGVRGASKRRWRIWVRGGRFGRGDLTCSIRCAGAKYKSLRSYCLRFCAPPVQLFCPVRQRTKKTIRIHAATPLSSLSSSLLIVPPYDHAPPLIHNHIMPALRTRDTQSRTLEVSTDAPAAPSLHIVSPTPRAFTFSTPHNLTDSPYASPSSSPFEPDLRSFPQPCTLSSSSSSMIATPPPHSYAVLRADSPFARAPSPPTPAHNHKRRKSSCSSDVVERRPKKGDEDYIKRPENAFILFRRKCCEDRQQAQEEAANADGGAGAGPTKKQRQADLSKTISQQWKSLSPEERQFWEQLAKDKKKEHESKYPNYVYRPQRAKDKDGKTKSNSKKASSASSTAAAASAAAAQAQAEAASKAMGYDESESVSLSSPSRARTAVPRLRQPRLRISPSRSPTSTISRHPVRPRPRSCP
ncbi:unnamed protein product [Cyclocybe aegerita]|uniref:HMG box domain-containing protein n=1 Tax=Cyclocybe aegerita TaxID=1973307 RepID=A0A8S0VQV0_CYCAE|nr:unnamed protein product [Cyclocybe aegerita]